MPNPCIQATYDQLCESYRAIDDTRMKLLAALPLASGTGIFFLLNRDTQVTPKLFLAVGAFGFVVTLGMAFYEAYGIRKCHALIKTGEALEIDLDVIGQFRTRPEALLRVVYEPLAAGIIYPAVSAAWMYLALNTWPITAFITSLLVFFSGFVVWLRYHFLSKGWEPPLIVQRHAPTRTGQGAH